MRKIFLALLAILPLLILAPRALAQNTLPLNIRQDKIVTLEEDEVVDKDYFATGDVVEILGTVNGDVYTAGGQVTVDGTVNGDLLVAGGDIRIRGTVTQDVRTAGGQIRIDGDIGRNVTALGGNVDITESANIEGNLVTGTGNLIIDGSIGGDVTAGTGTLTISGNVGGDVQAGVGQFRVTSQGNVDGNVTYWSEEEATISDDSVVGGEVTKNDPKKTVGLKDTENLQNELASASRKFASFVRIISFLAALLIGLVMVKLYPKYMMNTSKAISKMPWRVLAVGIVLLITIPILSVLLLVTLVGIPTALILMATYVIYLYLAKIYIAYWIGEILLKKADKKVSAGWVMFLGLIVYYLITFIPILGGLITLFTLFFGVGAAAIACREAYNSAKEKNII